MVLAFKEVMPGRTVGNQPGRAAIILAKHDTKPGKKNIKDFTELDDFSWHNAADHAGQGTTKTCPSMKPCLNSTV